MKFEVMTEHPLAVESYDHLYPMGTMRDNNSNPAFNNKLLNLLARPLVVMDLGCAGGGFVKSIIDGQNEAIGLEGSDYSLVRKRAEWATIPDNLFVCDIAKPFQVIADGIEIKFDVITAWDVLEHLTEIELPIMLANVTKHLKADGLFIATVSNHPSQNEYTSGIEMHRTIKDWDWWEELFNINNLYRNDSAEEFIQPDWVRGVSKPYVRNL